MSETGPQLTLYSRHECHLCEEMDQALAALRGELCFTLQTIDVDSAPEYRARYGKLVPVLVDADGVSICHYRLDETALRGRIAAMRSRIAVR